MKNLKTKEESEVFIVNAPVTKTLRGRNVRYMMKKIF